MATGSHFDFDLLAIFYAIFRSLEQNQAKLYLEILYVQVKFSCIFVISVVFGSKIRNLDMKLVAQNQSVGHMLTQDLKLYVGHW